MMVGRFVTDLNGVCVHVFCVLVHLVVLDVSDIPQLASLLLLFISSYECTCSQVPPFFFVVLLVRFMDLIALGMGQHSLVSATTMGTPRLVLSSIYMSLCLSIFNEGHPYFLLYCVMEVFPLCQINFV